MPEAVLLALRPFSFINAYALFPFLSEEVHETAVRQTLTMSTDDFQNIKIQLLALGLICKSERRRGVNDKGASSL